MDDLTAFTEPEFLVTQEHLARYRADGRGYHAVGLGDVLGGKGEDGNGNGNGDGKEGGGSGYVLRHKLGFGGFGVVWLGWDLGNERWVAIKIMIQEHPKFEMGEESMLWRLKGELGDGELGEKYIVGILDWFEEGGHGCLVFEVLGPSVEDVLEGVGYEKVGRNEVGGLETGVVLRISRELLCAVASLHERGWGHGDISARNVLFTAKSIANLDQEQIFDILGKPEVHELKRKDGKPLRNGLPKQIVKATTWEHWTSEDEDIRIIDFGEAFKQGEEPKVLRQPGSLQVPESILGDRLDFRVDLWRIGITIYAFVFGELPWMYLGDKTNLVASVIDFIGELPEEWKAKYEEMRRRDGIEWEPLEDPEKGKHAATRLERKFEEEVKNEPLKELLPVIKGMMQFKPEDRISAAEALAMVQEIERKYGEEHGT